MRIQENERSSVIAIWLAIGVALVVGTGTGLHRDLHFDVPLLQILAGLMSAIPLLLFFAVGVLILGGSLYTVLDKARNRIWLDVETPVRPGDLLRARVSAPRPLVDREGEVLEAELSCRERSIRQVPKIDRESRTETSVVERTLWSAKLNVPLTAGLASCEFEIPIPPDARPGDPAAAGLFSAQPGVYWQLGLQLPGRGAAVIRGFRIPVENRLS